MTDPRRALIVPWLSLSASRIIGRVRLLPRSAAIAEAGDDAAALALRTGVFIENDAIAFRLRAADGETPTIHPLNSTVIFLDDVDEYEARRAVIALGFATIAANEPPISYANGTTFHHLVQSLGGDPRFIADRRPRLHGTVHDGYAVEFMYEQRPRNAEHFHNGADDWFVNALAAASEQELSIAAALSIVRMAASDSADVDLTLAKSLFAAASLRALAKPGGSDAFTVVRDQVRGLLLPILGPGTTGDQYEYHIGRAWRSVRDDRNDWWHIDPTKTNEFPFDRQTTVRPHLIAFRMVQALLAARLVEMGLVQVTEVAEMVGSIEDWIGSIAENDPRDPNEAHSLRPFARVIRDEHNHERTRAVIAYMVEHGTLVGFKS